MPNQNQPPNFYLKKQSQSQKCKELLISGRRYEQLDQIPNIQLIYNPGPNGGPCWMPGEDKSRRGIQGFLSSEWRPTSPVTSRDFLGQMCWCVQQHQEFFLLWACPVSLWTPVNFLTFTAFCSEKFTLCMCVDGEQNWKTTQTSFCFRFTSFITASLLLEEARSPWLPFSPSLLVQKTT